MSVAFSDLGPIWRSIRRHRAFSLLVLEVTLGFFIVANLVITIRWYDSKGLPPSGHREQDLVEVMLRAPASRAPSGAGAFAADEAALAGLPGVRRVASVSATQIDDRWALPAVFWTDATERRGWGAEDEAVGARGPANACAGADRSADGTIAGWPVEADAALAETVDLRFVEGAAPRADSAAGGVIITRCLRDALFGGAPALGELLHSTRHPPARIVAVVEDVRMRVAFLFQTQVLAIYPPPVGDERSIRFLVRTEPGRAPEVRAAAARVLAAGSDGAPDPDRLVSARLFSLAGTRSALAASGTVVILGLVAVCLGVVSILGNLAVAAFFVGDRRRVIGLRRALGATRWDILHYLLLENFLATQIGNGLGLVLTLLFLPGAQKRFAGLHMSLADVLVAAAMLSLSGALATLVPAWRATRIPPSEISRAP
jgi:putative ABC transport system permease protein